MYNITFYYEGSVLKAKAIYTKKNCEPKKILISFSDAEELIKFMKDDIAEIKKIKFDGHDLVLKFNGLVIRLQNRKRFKTDDRFDFLFNFIKDKKYKIDKKGLGKKITAVALAAAIATTSAVLIKKSKNKVDAESITPNISYSNEIDSSITSSSEMNLKDDAETTVSLDENLDINKETTTSNNKEDINQTTVNSNNSNNNSKAEKDVEDSNVSYGVESDSEKAKRTRELYGDIIEKYSNMYGLSSDIICALATQERGVHSSYVDDGGAIGLMQIQVSVWTHETISAFNYEINDYEKIYISLDDLRDVDFNIKVGCAIFQNYLKQMNNNYIAALQCYNMGEGAMRSILNNYAYSTGQSVNDVLNDTSDLGWMEYRGGHNGDPNYVEHVMRYYDGDSLSKTR